MPNVILTQTYDALGRRDSLSATIDATPDFANTYGYDALSRLTQIIRTRPVNCILPGVVAWRGWQVPSGDQRWRVLVGEGNGNGSGAA